MKYLQDSKNNKELPLQRNFYNGTYLHGTAQRDFYHYLRGHLYGKLSVKLYGKLNNILYANIYTVAYSNL